MTNEQIIFAESQKLAEQGIISYTGREFIMKMDDGQDITIRETEDIHTFAAWKQRGFKVRKGEHAVAKFVIWKHSAPKLESLPMEDGSSVDYVDKGKMFMKQAAFFSASQVEPIEA